MNKYHMLWVLTKYNCKRWYNTCKRIWSHVNALDVYNNYIKDSAKHGNTVVKDTTFSSLPEDPQKYPYCKEKAQQIQQQVLQWVKEESER